MSGSPRIAPAPLPGPRDSAPSSGAEGPPSLPSYSSLHPGRVEHWRVHDRTHLELLVDYPINDGSGPARYVWEAYFFLPRSLKLDGASYPKDDIYRDFQSYVRFAATEPTFDELTAMPAMWQGDALEDSQRAMLVLRTYGAQFRVAALRGRERLLRYVDQGADSYLAVRLGEYVAGLRSALSSFRERTRNVTAVPVRAAVGYVEEDLSRLLEEVFSTLCVRLREADAAELAATAEKAALEEAAHRARSTSEPMNTSAKVDEAEFRRHALKRFTSSILWISRDISEAGIWVRHALFAVAASIAMVFAVVAAFYYGPQGPAQIGSFTIWVALVVVAYALKDRIKAWLQSIFSGWISRRFADRRWKLTYVDGRRRIGTVEERSQFVKMRAVPAAVLSARESGREHDVEEAAYPERVLSHRKDVILRSAEVARIDRPFAAATEIFRLDVSRWLVHTDDPKQLVYYADLQRKVVATALARRIYHVDIVYRIRTLQDAAAPWHTARVVLNRNGIRRVEARS